MSDCYPLKDESTIYWNDNKTQPNPEGWVGAFYRIGFPDFTREVLSPSCLDGDRVYFQGRYHLTCLSGVVGAMPGTPGFNDVYHVGPSPIGPFRRLRCDSPGRGSRLRFSNHYGLLFSLPWAIYQVELKLD